MLPFYASTDVELRLSLRMLNLLYTHLFEAGNNIGMREYCTCTLYIFPSPPYEKLYGVSQQCVYLNDNSGLIKYIKHIFNFQPRLLVFFNIFWQQYHTTAPFTPLPFASKHAAFATLPELFRNYGTMYSWWMDVWQPAPTQRFLAIGARCRRAP